ncbi:hypothetical protein [Acaryochloris sp. CCMEE 5410]|nr:hypothetical protein [Acaryochloris sp. CCMEE 5410]KAI9133142.1 hypothetical protein ON05_007305 [Acaryochloris sp. CCMEE 5410]
MPYELASWMLSQWSGLSVSSSSLWSWVQVMGNKAYHGRFAPSCREK